MQVKFLQNAQREHSAILSTLIKPPFVIKAFVSSIFEWSLKTVFTVYLKVCAHGCDRALVLIASGVSVRNVNDFIAQIR